MWAVMIERTPAAIAARNGTSGPASSSASETSVAGSARCESSDVSPCPGKCLAQAATPAACWPSTNAATCAATRAGSAPNERIPITGFSGFEFTSATGARFRLTPACRSSAPIAWPIDRVSATSSRYPSASGPGYGEPPRTCRRVTSPPSSSSDTSVSSRSPRSRPDSRATCSASRTLVANRTNPPTPASTQRSAQSGASRPWKGGEQAGGGAGREVSSGVIRARRRR